MKSATPAGSRSIAPPRNMASILPIHLRDQQLRWSIIRQTLDPLCRRTVRANALQETRRLTVAGSALVNCSKEPRSRCCRSKKVPRSERLRRTASACQGGLESSSGLLSVEVRGKLLNVLRRERMLVASGVAADLFQQHRQRLVG
jgi:hypothetical protein